MSAVPAPATDSVWPATAIAAPRAEALRGDRRADVAVIGGGYAGLSAALHLAESGADVVLLEAGEIGQGASGRNNGQVIPGFKYDPDELAAKLGEAGERMAAWGGKLGDLVFALIEKHGIDCAPRRAGWLQLAHSLGMARVVERRAAQWRGRGVDADFLDRSATAKILGTDCYHGAWIDRRAGSVQPLSYARGLAAAAMRAGARLFVHSPAQELEKAGRGWRVATDRGSVTADAVLVATNAYTGDLWPGLKRSFIPAHSIQSATAPLDASLRRSILPRGEVASDTQRIIFYYRLDPSGRFIIGGRGSFGETNPPLLFRYIERAASRFFPFLRQPRWEYRWGGKIAMTTDSMPRLHALAPGVFAALGCNGRGVALATGMGKLLADLARGAAAADISLPMTELRQIPLFEFRRPALAAIAHYYRLRDMMG
jgi:glycine/D-amino acid oxidase-like deaminating enzyme